VECLAGRQAEVEVEGDTEAKAQADGIEVRAKM
jgi:hypothetical protein